MRRRLPVDRNEDTSILKRPGRPDAQAYAIRRQKRTAMPHEHREQVTIAVLTYRRAADLDRILPLLLEQAAKAETSGWPTEVLVVDNDPEAGARDQVKQAAGLRAAEGRRLRYVHEAVPGISAARNRAMAASPDSELLVFIDDDESPGERWLMSLLETYADYAPAAVVGPVRSTFEVEPEPWIEAGRFFARRRLATGTPVQVAATNNLLLSLPVVRRLGLEFDPDFGISGGADSLFTLQLHRQGGPMVWCSEALVDDVVPSHRLTRRWVVTRAFRSGNSWSRVQLRMEGSGARRGTLRLRLLGPALLRASGGTARATFGTLTRSDKHQARGIRTAARGLGMLSGMLGYTHLEYGRTPKRGKQPRKPHPAAARREHPGKAG